MGNELKIAQSRLSHTGRADSWRGRDCLWNIASRWIACSVRCGGGSLACTTIELDSEPISHFKQTRVEESERDNRGRGKKWRGYWQAAVGDEAIHKMKKQTVLACRAWATQLNRGA